MSVLVSIVCITYNHEKYIADAVKGFLMQKTDFDYEIIIGEDKSSDKTLDIVREYERKYPDKIRIITSTENVGMIKNERRVINAAEGKYIAECEGDDYWTDPYKLQKQVDYMENNPDCTFCFHNALKMDINNKNKGLFLKKENTDKKYNIDEMLKLEFLPTASRLYKRENIANMPSWYEKCIVTDIPSQVILTSYGYAYCMSDIMSVYRVNVENSATYCLYNGGNFNHIKTEEGKIFIYKNLNEFLEKKSSTIINNFILRSKFRILYFNGNLKNMKEACYKDFYNKLTKFEKGKIFLRYYFPWIYKVIKEQLYKCGIL